MDSDCIDTDIIKWPKLGIDAATLQFIKNIKPVNDVSKDCVFPIEVRVCCIHDEELRLVRVRAFIGHADYSAFMVKFGGDFVGKWPSPDRFPALSLVRWVASLY